MPWIAALLAVFTVVPPTLVQMHELLEAFKIAQPEEGGLAILLLQRLEEVEQERKVKT